MISRRQFVASATLAAVVAASAPRVRAAVVKPLIGSQLYGWGQYYQRDKKDFGSHLGDIYSALRDSGYDYAEGSLNVGTPDANHEMVEQMKARGLKPVSLYSGAHLHEASSANNVESIVTAAKVAAKSGFSILNVNPDPIGREKTDSELEIQAKNLDLLGSELSKIGMKFGVHNHTPEMVNGGREYHSNFKRTSSASVGFCYDVHWVFRGAVKPDAALKDYGSRIVSWHLRQSREGIWWEDLDTGDVDYAAIARTAHDHGYPPFYTVELALENGTKITRSAVENHKRSLEFVRKVLVG